MRHPIRKDFSENLVRRNQLLVMAERDRSVQAEVKRICKEDLLWWLNYFGRTFDPRLPEQKCVPFLTFPFQDETLLSLEESLGKEDVVIEKSRDMGASWIILCLFLHRWLFYPYQAFALISREAELVDKKGNPKSLFWKLDFLLEGFPRWMVPKYKRVENHLLNLENGSVMDGFSTTGHVMAGDRRTAALLDEFARFEDGDSFRALAATQHATNCRLYNSTPCGTTGAFAQLRGSGVKLITLHWTLDPRKTKGQYQDLSVRRGANPGMRSPWYDNECKRMPVPALIAQELDIDYAGSVSQFFPAELIDRLMTQETREPFLRGRIEPGPDARDPQWVEDAQGNLLLWTFLRDGKPALTDQFCMGIDISAGTGATNSVLSIADRRTGDKVGELAVATLSPDRFAELAVGVARWFNDAFLIWEMNGPGGPFGKQVIDLGYRNLYYRQDEQGLVKAITASLIPGWFASRENKRLLFGEYVAALANGRFMNRSRDALQECRHYVYLPNGGVGNARAQSVGDPSGARENHGDRPTADALCCKGLNDAGAVPATTRQAPKTYEEFLHQLPTMDPPPGSWAWRRKQAPDHQRTAALSWDSNPDSKKGWQASPQAPLRW